MFESDKELNERLLRLYGKEKLTERQKYRIVRSELQTEKRFGSYDLVTQETGIWFGSRTGLVEIKKYWYLKPSWILERVEPNLNRNDIIYDKWSYEPIFTFLDKDDNPLPLNWRAIEFIVSRLEKAERKLVTEADHLEAEEKRMAEESDKVFAILDKPDPVKELPTFSSSTLLTGSNKSKLVSLR